MDWYYSVGGETIGPVSFEALQELVREDRVAPTDLVWNADMGDKWSPASQVPGLFSSPPAEQVVSPVLPPTDAHGLRKVSCVEPVEIAWERMKDILFRPFDMKKWFLLGFTAWLATLGQSGGGGGGGGSFNPWGKTQGLGDFSGNQQGSPDEMISESSTFFHEHLTFILGVGLSVFAVLLIIGLVFLWLQSRGKFMFLDNVVQDRQEIKHPWTAFRQHGNSLFLWRVVYGIICLAFSMILLLIFYFSVVRHVLHSVPWSDLYAIIALNGILWLIFIVINIYIMRLLNDFIVPLMYDRDLKATEAWSEFLGLLGQRFFGFIVYGLFYLVLYMLFGLAVVALLVVTCCIAGCVMVIPWVGTVVILPALVFFRIYSLEYLAQFGPEYRMRLDSEKI
jgi:hypothetical protein